MTASDQRPVVPGFHPDPSVCVVDGVAYLANSTFEYAPGVPIHASTDFRTWTLVGHALHRPDQLPLAGTGPSGGIFAPTLRHHDGRFWMITTNVADEQGQVLVTAEDAAGPWSEAIRIPGIDGIDPDIAWGEDGTCYVTYAGRTGIAQVEIDPATGEVLTEPRLLWSGTGGKFPEGPHLLERDGHWYLLIAEGGTERGHSVSIARGPSPSGPFTGNPANPILTKRGTSSSVQSTGHSDLVEIAPGVWALVYLAVRPRGSSPEWHVLGRETFASAVEWIDGWPVVGAPIEPPERPSRETLVRGEALPPTWVGDEVFPTDVVEVSEHGWTLTGSGSQETFVGRRQDRLFFSARAALSTTGEAALSVRIDRRHRFRLELEGDRLSTVLVVGGHRVVLDERAAVTGAELQIRTFPVEGGFFEARGPDHLVGGVVVDGVFTETGRADGRYVSTEVAGGMTGRIIGIEVGVGRAELTAFTYVGSDEPLAEPFPVEQLEETTVS
ncbi:glycoside hydrolase family 43 protein [Rathayibacter sp. VKM Ac-2857]|uniref:glycoside hydrolase family 43 protein n=1 Tax=Rathayibacter sp. VKM Ac-2857 TaxID=2739020 RepID=UPI0015676855|nr:glycoside hydrolase family 43 protein [Rathayibacter sp. VKM Ac-2857]NQX18065.1 glycoside hydrolase family 43 protein [Rathayibacter sp. VKM Ac-2857]